jgi:hypothetical protein
MSQLTRCSPRRPVRDTHNPNFWARVGYKFDHAQGKYIGLPPSNFIIGAVSPMFRDEALAIGYKENTFSFNSTADAELFVKTIGKQARHLRKIVIPDDNSYTSGAGLKLFDRLLPATYLRSLELNHRMICSTRGCKSSRVSMAGLVEDILPLLETLHKSMKSKNDTSYEVLDIIKIVPEKNCFSCKYPSMPTGKPCFYADGRGTCKVPCGDQTETKHCLEVEKLLKKMLAAALRIQL